MAQLDESWGLNNADLLQQLIMLRWVQGDEGSKKQFENLTQMRVGYEIWQRLSGQRDTDALRNQTILSISKYVKDHPKATKEQLTKEIGRQILEFADKIEKL